MKKLLAVLLMAGVGLAQEKPSARGGKIEWRQDYESAMRDARLEGRVIMLYFTADW